MNTDTETIVYMIFHFIRFILNVFIFIGSLLYLISGVLDQQMRLLKRQWHFFNISIGMIFFAIINSVFSMLPLAPTYSTILIGEVCTLEHYFKDVVQGQVAYSLLAFAIHQLGPRYWRNESFIWFGVCIVIQWLCSYLFPLPQIVQSNMYICLGFVSNEFLTNYSIIFLFALPIFLHLLIYLLMFILRKNEMNVNRVYPMEEIHPIEMNIRSLMNYLILMGFLFDIIGYGPRSFFATTDPNLTKSIAVYSILEILPSLCLLINLGIIYYMNRDIPKKLLLLCRF